MNDALAGLGAEELRAAVRAVLRDVLPDGLVAEAARAAPAGQGEVVIATAADLTAFVRRVAALCEDADVRAALQAGTHGFRLSGASGGVETVAARPPQPASTVRVERGAVTERAVARAAADGARLVLGPRAVLTPLARDKARSLGVEIEKEH
jgi:hypothetical protein